MTKKAEKSLNNEKVITDQKLIYLIRTLSRTNRKDYENYVINTIWNKLDNDKIEVVSQQYINNPKGKRKHYFIDLYFPALNIGIECDEAYHLDENNKKTDGKREANISGVLQEKLFFDELHDRKVSSGYHAVHIDVTKSFDNVQKQIDAAVLYIKNKYNEIKPDDWHIVSVEEYFKNRENISIRDNIGFKNINQACNILFSTDYIEETKGTRGTCFIPRKFKNNEYDKFKGTRLEGYKVWFLKLAIKDENGRDIAASPSGWKNLLTKKGKKIVESNEGLIVNEGIGEKRIAFAYYKNPLRQSAYKFIGIFELKCIEQQDGTRYWERFAADCDLIKY